MQEGVIIFAQKDVDDGLIEFMEAYANDMGVSVPDMVKQVFIHRMAKDIAHNEATGAGSPEFLQDVKTLSFTQEWPVNTLLVTMVDHILDNQYKTATAGVLQ